MPIVSILRCEGIHKFLILGTMNVPQDQSSLRLPHSLWRVVEKPERMSTAFSHDINGICTFASLGINVAPPRRHWCHPNRIGVLQQRLNVQFMERHPRFPISPRPVVLDASFICRQDLWRGNAGGEDAPRFSGQSNAAAVKVKATVMRIVDGTERGGAALRWLRCISNRGFRGRRCGGCGRSARGRIRCRRSS